MGFLIKNPFTKDFLKEGEQVLQEEEVTDVMASCGDDGVRSKILLLVVLVVLVAPVLVVPMISLVKVVVVLWVKKMSLIVRSLPWLVVEIRLGRRIKLFMLVHGRRFWGFHDRILLTMNFGSKFRGMVRCIYTDIQSAIISNGFVSDNFPVERGVRQGCPLSPLLFVLVAEVFGQAIQKCPEIKGLHLPGGKEIKITQYADDNTCIVTNSYGIFKVIEVFNEWPSIWCALEQNKVERFLVRAMTFPDRFPLRS